MKYGPRKKI
jgi:hypothetical protein